MKIIQENSSYLFNNQSLKLISLSEIHIIIQEEEEIFKKSPTVGLPEVSKLFHVSKCLACNAEKLLQLKITKKE